jgi:hypothetical protein
LILKKLSFVIILIMIEDIQDMVDGVEKEKIAMLHEKAIAVL